MADDDAAFEGYIENTLDPSPWLFVFTTIFSFTVMLVAVPLAVHCIIRRQNRLQVTLEASPTTETPAITYKEPIEATFHNVACSQQETMKILKLAVPYTVSALTIATCSNICLIFVSQRIGTKQVAAYALVQILVGLTDGFLLGPIAACTTLCSHSYGLGNFFLAGQFVQLAITMYVIGSIPLMFVWSFSMYNIVLFLQWGDEETAMYSQEFVRVFIWNVVLTAIHNSIWQLLIVAGHAYKGTIVSILFGLTNVMVIGLLVNTRDATLTDVGLAYIGTALFYISVTLVVGTIRGWFKPFWKGLLGAVAIRNRTIVSLMLKQALPLSFGSLISNAEWSLFTFFASHLGPAEVAAWALLGSIWEIFYSVITGIGDATEIRVAYHLGDNHPTMARLSAYKSLMLGMAVACLVSIIYFSMSSQIPGWFTTDETLQGMLSQLVPFVGLANLTMTFGMQCWSIIGAQGKYNLATWISLVSSWGVSMPLAALFVYVFRFNLQGVTSAVVMGYLATGATLSCVVLLTDWHQVASTIQRQNAVDSLRENNIAYDRPNSGIINQTASDFDQGMMVDVVPGLVHADDLETSPTSDYPDPIQTPSAPSASRGDPEETAIPKDSITASSLFTEAFPAQDNAGDSSPLESSHPTP